MIRFSDEILNIDFIGIGEGKSGSTWIFKCLKEHPDVCVSSTKETHFFDRHYKKGIKFYRKYFSHCNEGKKVGEFTPTYLSHKECPSRIKKHVPQAKLFVCLRDPLDQIISGYYFNRSRAKISNITLEEYIEKKDLSYLKYSHNIKNFLNFFSEEQVKVTFYDDLKNDPSRYIKDLYRFIGIDENYKPTILEKKTNKTVQRSVAIRSVNRLLFCVRGTIKRYRYLNWLESVFRFLGVHKLALWIFKINRSKRPTTNLVKKRRPSQQVIERIRKELVNDISDLERMTNRDLSHWCK